MAPPYRAVDNLIALNVAIGAAAFGR